MKKCFECGADAEEDHHVVPKSLGGTATVPLCSACHGRLHGIKNRENHKELTTRAFDKKRREELCFVWWQYFYEELEEEEIAKEMERPISAVKRMVKRILDMTPEWRKELFEPVIGEIKYHNYCLESDK